MTKFCTVEDAKNFSATSNSYAGYDDLYLTAIELATEQIMQFTNKDFGIRAYSEYFRTPDTLMSPIPFFAKLTGPNVDPNTIVVQYDSLGLFDSTALTLTKDRDYAYEEYGHKLVFSYIFDYTARGLKVSYTAGYPVDDVDPDIIMVPGIIKQACALQVATFVERVLRQNVGHSTDMSDTEGVRIVYEKETASGLLPQVQSMLRGFRRPLVGRM